MKSILDVQVQMDLESMLQKNDDDIDEDVSHIIKASWLK
jgi:hypothetical protein